MAWFSEFRDGNCPAAWRNPEVFERSLALLPNAVKEVRLRTDTAGYDHRLLKYCADGHNKRFGVIDFAIGVDITPSFKRAVRRVETWHPLEAEGPDGIRWPTDQQWARVDFVPDWLGYTRRNLGISYFASRQPLAQPELFEAQRQLPFPTLDFAERGPSKVFGLVTNRQDLTGDEIIRWHRKRCGWSEQAHSEFKHGLSGHMQPASRRTLDRRHPSLLLWERILRGGMTARVYNGERCNLACGVPRRVEPPVVIKIRRSVSVTENARWPT